MSRFVFGFLVVGVLLGAAIGTRFYARRHKAAPPSTAFDAPDVQQSALPRSKGGIVLAGDSLTDWGEWKALLPRPVLNYGVAGDTTADLRARLSEILRHKPAKIFLLIGTNDVAMGRATDDILDDYRGIVVRVKQQSPASTLFVQSIPPLNDTKQGQASTPEMQRRVKAVNSALPRFADGKRVVFVDLHPVLSDASGNLNPRLTSDGVHLNQLGYEKWAGVLRPLLK